jgi:hypothetical protein
MEDALRRKTYTTFSKPSPSASATSSNAATVSTAVGVPR